MMVMMTMIMMMMRMLRVMMMMMLFCLLLLSTGRTLDTICNPHGVCVWLGNRIIKGVLMLTKIGILVLVCTHHLVYWYCFLLVAAVQLRKQVNVAALVVVERLNFLLLLLDGSSYILNLVMSVSNSIVHCDLKLGKRVIL